MVAVCSYWVHWKTKTRWLLSRKAQRLSNSFYRIETSLRCHSTHSCNNFGNLNGTEKEVPMETTGTHRYFLWILLLFVCSLAALHADGRLIETNSSALLHFRINVSPIRQCDHAHRQLSPLNHLSWFLRYNFFWSFAFSVAAWSWKIHDNNEHGLSMMKKFQLPAPPVACKMIAWVIKVMSWFKMVGYFAGSFVSAEAVTDALNFNCTVLGHVLAVTVMVLFCMPGLPLLSNSRFYKTCSLGRDWLACPIRCRATPMVARFWMMRTSPVFSICMWRILSGLL